MDYAEYIEKLKQDDPSLLMSFDKGDGTAILIRRLIFHFTVIQTEIGNFEEYLDRWCYQTFEGALNAVLGWEHGGWEGEPTGWHRHPATGRRRENGDERKETISQ